MVSSKSKRRVASTHKDPSYNAPIPSILSRFVLFPFYDQVVKVYPSCINPNSITMFGIISTLIASFFILSAMPPVMPRMVQVNTIDATLSSLSRTHKHSIRHIDLATAAGEAFLSYINISNNNNPDMASTVGLWLSSHYGGGSIDPVNGGLHSEISKDDGTMTACSHTGLYGKQIHFLPKSLWVLAEEVFNIMSVRESSIRTTMSSVKETKDDEVLSTTRVIKSSDKYEFHYPVPFSSALVLCSHRYSIAIRMLLSNITGSFFNFAKAHTNLDDYIDQFELLWEHIINLSIPTLLWEATNMCTTTLFNLFTKDIREIPGRWMLIIAGVLNLIYCVADNTDGRHARRTNKTSFVGEYLDHGLDCATSLFSTFILMLALGGEAYYSGFSIFCVAFVTLMSHIINQEKSIMIWGNSLVTVDEAMVMFGAGLILMGVYPDIIPTYLPIEMLRTYFGVSYVPEILYHIRVTDVLMTAFVFFQCQVSVSIVKNDISVLFCRFTTWAMFANIAVMTYFTNVFGQPISSHVLSGTLRKNIRNAIESSDQLRNLFPFIANTSDSLSYCTTNPQTNPIDFFLPEDLKVLLYQSIKRLHEFIPDQFVHFLQALDSSVEMLFTYEAQWVIVAACTCSIIVHVPIVSKSLRIPVSGNVLPILISLPPIWVTFFCFSSTLGAVLAVVCHVVQILVNIYALQVAGSKRAKRK